MDGEAHFLVPFWSLASPLVGFGLLCLFAQSRSTVRILLAHCPAVWEVLSPVDNHHERPDLWTIDGHVGKDSGSVHAAEGTHLCNFSSHCAGGGGQTVRKGRKGSSGSFKSVLFQKAWGAAWCSPTEERYVPCTTSKSTKASK